MATAECATTHCHENGSDWMSRDTVSSWDGIFSVLFSYWSWWLLFWSQSSRSLSRSWSWSCPYCLSPGVMRPRQFKTSNNWRDASVMTHCHFKLVYVHRFCYVSIRVFFNDCLVEFERSTKKRIGPSTRFYITISADSGPDLIYQVGIARLARIFLYNPTHAVTWKRHLVC